MATVISAPSGLQLLQNMQAFRISSLAEITFVLKRSNDEVILSETYKPGSGSQIEIQIRDIIARYLETTIPTQDEYTQSAAAATFAAFVDGNLVATIRAVNGGVRKLATTAEEFLTANWLTWQPQSKAVTWSSPEWLSYYCHNSSARRVRAKFYLKNGNTTTITVASCANNALTSYNMTMSRLFALASLTPSDAYGVVDVWVETTSGDQLSYVQRYICRDTLGDEHAFLAVNSLGGVDTFLFHGECRGVPEVEHEAATREDVKVDITSKAIRKWEQSTGYLGLDEAKWLFELLTARKAWAVIDGDAEQIVIDGDSVEFSDRENLQDGSFTFQLSNEGRLLNVSRTSGTLPAIEVPSPDGAIFFLEARLIDYPDADLSETLLFLLQQPYSNNWKKASFAAIFNHIYTAILASPVGQLAHSHDNGALLAALSEANDHLALSGRKLAFIDELTTAFPAAEWVDPIFDEASGLTVGMKTRYPMVVNGNLAALGDVIAYAPDPEQDDEPDTPTPTAYERLDFVDDAWPEYDEDKTGWILSAALGWDLNSRVAALEAETPHTHANLAVLNTITAEKIQSWDAGGIASQLFEAIEENGSVVGIRAKHPITVVGGITTSGAVAVTGNVTATGDIVAYGSSSGAGAPTAYDRLDPVSGAWPAYDATKTGWILSAALGWDLLDRISGKQDALVSGTNIKTINGTSILGSGNIAISGGSGGSGESHTHDNKSVLDGITSGKVSSWDTVASLFSSAQSGDPLATTGINALYPLSVAGNVVATGDIVAYGSSSGAGAPTAYDRLDPVSGDWPTYDATKAGWILSAALGWDLLDKHGALATRVTNLENSSSGGSGGSGDGHTHGNKSVLDTITSGKVSSWDTVASLFSAAQSGDPLATTGINALYPLSVAGNVVATGDIVAYGSSSGAGAPTAYDRLDPVSGDWPTYDATKAGWILSAALGWDLDSRVTTLETSGGGSGGGSDHTHSNKTVLDGITAALVTNWNTAYTNNHTHSNLSVLETITAERIEAWDAGGSGGGGETGHSHSNLSVLNNITSTKTSNWDTAYTNSHTHSNKSVLDGITSTKVSRWDSAWNEIGYASYDTNGNALATQSWVTSRGYLTSHQSLADYAKLTDLHSHSNKTVLDDITSTKVSNWDGAVTNSHTHSNKTVLDGITSTRVSNWDGAATNSHTHSNKTVLDGITSTKVSNWDGAATNSHTHSNKTVLDAITSTKTSNWDSAYSDSHSHSNKSVLDDITSTKVSNWDTVAAGSWLALSGGTLSGGLTGTTLAMRTATFGDASNAGSISIVRKIGNKTYTATVSIDSSGNVTITPTSTGIIIAAGTVKASGDVLGYN